MQLRNQGTAFLPEGGILPGGSYPVYPTLEVAEDGAVTGELHFASEPKYPRPISQGREFDVHILHPDSILGDYLVMRVKFVDESGTVNGYVHGSPAQFRPQREQASKGRMISKGTGPEMSYFHAQVVLKDKKADNLFEYDLSKEYVADKVAKPFVLELGFFFGGASVRPTSVERIRIVKTETPANELAEAISREYRSSGVGVGVNMAKRMIVTQTEKSVDITREILDEVQTVSNVPEAIRKAVASREKPAQSPKTVFIVHGHDHDLLRDLELALHRWKLDPIVLSERASRGMTLVEKVEANTDVGFAFVLLTPDDYGGTDIGRLQRRARQNVIWEWGYLVGRLGRDRVCCLYKEGVEIPSDLHGIARIVVRTNLNENLEEIRRELKEAGFEIP